MRVLPVTDPGTPDCRSPWHYLAWLMRQQRGSVALGILWGCTWMLSQALMPAVIGASIDALIGRDTTSFSRDCIIVLGLGLITAVSGILRHRCVVSNFLDAAYRSLQLVTEHVSRLGETMTRLVSTGEIARADLLVQELCRVEGLVRGARAEGDEDQRENQSYQARTAP